MSSLPATFVKDFHDEKLCKRMEYRTHGLTGLEVSKVSLGTGTLSDFYGELDVDEAIKTIHKALKSGINYIDTAPYYGQGRSEEVLGMALKDVPREAYYIATKVGRYEKDFGKMFDFSAKKTRASVEKSLKLLGIDYVDIIQIHDIEFAKDLDIVINECLAELEKIVKEGKAKFIGVTGYPLARLKECIERAPDRFHSVLTYTRYSLLDDSLKSYLDFFQQQNLGIVCASGHALGLLTNAGPQAWHPAGEEIKEICRKAANICKEANVELGKLAMHYFMQLDGVSTFLTGMQTRQLLDINLAAYYDGLNKKEQEVLQLLRDTIFTKSLNWEGNELETYWAAMKTKK
ncbi:L-galactose dehydrogenase-like [Rhagoletis pomonella]|uniref:L-galactose dehydrogenase-like n=1 Tax=Rhagoletis pomonella TaxID=28610 RepID=UPI00177F7964|nr:L-galactose dehydrogenase-like [Rhagoletis pomonella]